MATRKKAKERRHRRPVVLESPYAGNITANLIYAKACMKDSLSRGEAPFASHLLYPQEGLLDDGRASERTTGLECCHSWIRHAAALVVYRDLGTSDGMAMAIRAARRMGVSIEYRALR